METLPAPRTWMALLLSLLMFTLIVTDVAREDRTAPERRTEPIRENLQRLRETLRTLERPFEAIHEVRDSEQTLLMHDAVGLLKEYLLPHLAAEEAILYAAADRELPATPARLTEALRKEHEILRRWVGELEHLADAPRPDPNAFVRRGQRLLGLIEAHVEVDEEILLPVLDRATPLSRARGVEPP